MMPPAAAGGVPTRAVPLGPTSAACRSGMWIHTLFFWEHHPMVTKTDPLADVSVTPPAPEAVVAPTTTLTASAIADEAPASGTVASGTADEGAVADERERHAHTIIRNHVLLATGAAVIPVAFLDTAALAAVQLRLLKELSEVYGVSFRADLGKEAVGTLFASVAPALLSGGILGSAVIGAALRSVPVIGTVTRFATLPLFHAAFTYALGKVFQQHFASGGTFLTFDPEKVKTYFRQKYEEARNRKGVVEPDAVAA